jgi:phage terminase small subunit
MALNNKQRAFVEVYLSTWNAAEAARRAGYSEKTARAIGHENLTKPDIAAAIKIRLAEMQMDADEALVRIAQKGRGSLAPFLNATADGFDLTTDRAQAELGNIKRYKTKRRVTVNRDGDRIEELEQDVELYDALAAEQLIGRHHALFTDKIVDDSLSDDDRAARIAAILDRARARRDGQTGNGADRDNGYSGMEAASEEPAAADGV